MDRFSAYLLLKQQVRDAGCRRRARVAEHAMTRIAARLGQNEETWGTMGLLLYLDQPYAEHNQRVARGIVARQHAELDGLAPELGASLERCWRADAPTPLEASLRLVDWLVEREDAEHEPGDDRRVDLGRQLERARQSGGPEGDLLDAALAQLELESAQAARIVCEARTQVEASP